MNKLFESYKDRLSVAERLYESKHSGAKLSDAKKLLTAKMLDNTNKFLSEAYNNSLGTQRSDMGLFKKFSMNLVNVVVPNLIISDIMKVFPMSSMSGFISYVKLVAGSNKGTTSQGKVFNSPFALGDVDVNYTSAKVISEAKPAAVSGTAYSANINWTPVVAGTVDIIVGSAEFKDDGNGKLYAAADVTVVPGGVADANGNIGVRTITVAPGATQVGTVDYKTGAVAFSDTTVVGAVSINYVYDNVVIPANDLPIYSAKMDAIALTAKARRIAIQYSNLAAYQAKTDYGFDLGDMLAEQAVGELAYEIDTEGSQLLIDNASQDDDLVWSKTLPYGVSLQQHYAAFSDVLSRAKNIVYKRTKKYTPNFVLVSPTIMNIVEFIPGFTKASEGDVAGPYFAGSVNGLKVFVTPNIEDNTFVVGTNSEKMEATAAVYAPYLPIVPTQLLGFADGEMSQGFSTMYDLKILNPMLLIAGRVTA